MHGEPLRLCRRPTGLPFCIHLQGNTILDAGPAPQLEATIDRDLRGKDEERKIRALSWLASEGLVSVQLGAYRRSQPWGDIAQLQVSLHPGIYEATEVSEDVSVGSGPQ